MSLHSRSAASSPRRIHLLLPTFQPNDAVGNDVLGMYHVLRAAGYDANVFAQYIHPQLQRLTRTVTNENGPEWTDPDAILIYHHAIDWEVGERILERARCKLVIKYHNVTPPHFYSNYAEHYYWGCVRGIETTHRLARIPNTWIWGDSWFNAREFVDLGVAESRCRVVAPIHRIDDLARQPFDAVVAGKYRGPVANLLFVGGIRPNKGHAKALEVFSAYRASGAPPARLLFVGNYDPNLKLYLDELKEYIAQLELSLEDDVIFATSVTPAQLRSYYMTSTAFLCVSEHEGFCVPLVEAMAFRAPIVAWATTAVGETAGDAGWISTTYDSSALAGALAEIIDNPDTTREFARRGRERYESVFHSSPIERQLLSLVREVESS